MLIAAGFLGAVVGLVLMIPFVDTSQRAVAFLVGLFLFGLGVGAMLTPSVNVVQSSFPEELQGEISGLSRSVSNLGSSFGTAIAGTILVSAIATGTPSYVVAMIVLVGFGLLGLLAALPPARIRRPAGNANGLNGLLAQSPCRRAHMPACIRSSTPIARNALVRWALTVFSLISRRRAICLLGRPSLTRDSTCALPLGQNVQRDRLRSCAPSIVRAARESIGDSPRAAAWIPRIRSSGSASLTR